MTRYTKADLVEDLQLQDLFADASKKATTEFVEDFFQLMADKVAEGTEVSIPRFGKFYPYTLKSGKVVPKFVAFKEFKDAFES